MNLKGEKVLLRAIEICDLTYLKELINNPEIEKKTGGWGKPVSDYEQKQWFENIKLENNKIRFAIDVDNRFIGTIILENIDWKNRKACISIKILPKEGKQGYGSDALRTLKQYAFEELNLNRLEAYVLEENVASKKLFLKNKFTQEAILSEYVFKENRYQDTVVFRILKKEYDV